MAATILSSCNSYIIQDTKKRILHQPTAKGNQRLHGYQKKRSSYRRFVFAATKGSANSSKSEETIPSWARPDSDEPPPWASDEGKESTSQQSFEIPFAVYLLASAVTAIAAIGSIFEYVNQRPVFGVLNSDSIFYAPLLGFFVFTGIPTSAFLWFKSVQVANKEAEEQDKRDGYLSDWTHVQSPDPLPSQGEETQRSGSGKTFTHKLEEIKANLVNLLKHLKIALKGTKLSWLCRSSIENSLNRN